MAIYKTRISRTASLKHTISFGIYGFITGVYIFQPLLKAMNQHEQQNETFFSHYFKDSIQEMNRSVQQRKISSEDIETPSK